MRIVRSLNFRVNGLRRVVDMDVGATGGDPMDGVLAAVRALARGIDSYRHAIATQLGLGIPEIVTLGQLLHEAPLRAAEVGTRTGLSPGSVTALLDRLEARGCITRSRPPHNKRTVAIELTPAGRDLASGMFAPMEPLLRQAAAEPGAPDPERLVHCLSRIAEVFDELADAAVTGRNPG